MALYIQLRRKEMGENELSLTSYVVEVTAVIFASVFIDCLPSPRPSNFIHPSVVMFEIRCF